MSKPIYTYCRAAALRFLRPVLSVYGKLKAQLRFMLKCPQKPHKLHAPLIISLTSYPPRFPTLYPTLQTLLTQSLKPDRVILWIEETSLAALPKSVRALQNQGLEIRTVPALGPYTKIIPALRAFPDAFIVTADDDVYYRAQWLESLVTAWSGDAHEIVCHRAHGIGVDGAGAFLSYAKWERDIAGPLLSRAIFPTGGGGILYPPRVLPSEVLDDTLFLKLAPKADDIWLFWMGMRAGAIYRKTKGRTKLITWTGSQSIGLLHDNLFGAGNDEKIRAMASHFGWPVMTDANENK